MPYILESEVFNTWNKYINDQLHTHDGIITAIGADETTVHIRPKSGNTFKRPIENLTYVKIVSEKSPEAFKF